MIADTTTKMAEDLKSLVEYVQANGRVCPMPDCWHRIWEMLPDRRQVGSGYEPPPPLILGGWWHSSNREKALRLRAHIEWAAQRDTLDAVGAVLWVLAEDEWHHRND